MKLALIALVIVCKLLSGFDAPGETMEDEMPVQYHVVKHRAEGSANASQQVKSSISNSVVASGK